MNLVILSHTLSDALGLLQNDAVIGITHERKSAPFKFAVKFRKHYVAQYGAEWAALWHALCRFLILVPDHDSCVEVLVYQRYDPAVFNLLAKKLYQLAVADRVKELLKVKVYAVFIAVINDFLRLLQSLMRAASRAEAVACFRELWFVHQTQHLGYGLLDDAVYYGGDTE